MLLPPLSITSSPSLILPLAVSETQNSTSIFTGYEENNVENPEKLLMIIYGVGILLLMACFVCIACLVSHFGNVSRQDERIALLARKSFGDSSKTSNV